MDIHIKPFLIIRSAKGWLPVGAMAAVVAIFFSYYWLHSLSVTRCDATMKNITIENTGESGWTNKNLHPCVDGLTIRGTLAMDFTWNRPRRMVNLNCVVSFQNCSLCDKDQAPESIDFHGRLKERGEPDLDLIKQVEQGRGDRRGVPRAAPAIPPVGGGQATS
jgi:hypothetical protein